MLSVELQQFVVASAILILLKRWSIKQREYNIVLTEMSRFIMQLFLQLNIVDGKMQYMFDEDGCCYLDAFSGIATVCCGHCHPDIVEAMANRAKRIQHSTVIYLNNAIVDFAHDWHPKCRVI
jgi:acetylornithine/succinyldiaminopimelate/putrescine aminotransferase